MKRSMRRPTRIARLGLVAAGSAMLLSGCVLTSPTPVSTPYPAGDGTGGTISDASTGSVVKLANFLLVSAGKGQPGNLIGAVINNGTSSVSVQLSLFDAADAGSSATPLGQASVQVQPGHLAKVGDVGQTLVLASTPQPPGALLTMRAETASGGSIQFQVPVLPAEAEYASLTPTAVPSS